MKRILLLLVCFSSILSLNSCGLAGNILNPFYESPSPEALLGERNDHAISGDNEKLDKARLALETSASYRRANAPQPIDPVIQPAVVRLMWIPDHLNRNGDLVPAHFYYLKVLKDRWAVTDAFELESQLGGGSGNGSNLPFVSEGSR